jgi:copper chaperone CopZ
MADAAEHTERITVAGMTCGHCVAAVTDELSRVPGVRTVHVDLDSGVVEVRAVSAIDPAALAVAVEAAGYTLTAAKP